MEYQRSEQQLLDFANGIDTTLTSKPGENYKVKMAKLPIEITLNGGENVTNFQNVYRPVTIDFKRV